jgi:hypothetical protein
LFLDLQQGITAYEKKTGEKFEVTRAPREVLAESSAAADLSSAFYFAANVHGGEVGKSLTNDPFPGWSPKKILDVTVVLHLTGSTNSNVLYLQLTVIRLIRVLTQGDLTGIYGRAMISFRSRALP